MFDYKNEIGIRTLHNSVTPNNKRHELIRNWSNKFALDQQTFLNSISLQDTSPMFTPNAFYNHLQSDMHKLATIYFQDITKVWDMQLPLKQLFDKTQIEANLCMPWMTSKLLPAFRHGYSKNQLKEQIHMNCVSVLIIYIDFFIEEIREKNGSGGYFALMSKLIQHECFFLADFLLIQDSAPRITLEKIRSGQPAIKKESIEKWLNYDGFCAKKWEYVEEEILGIALEENINRFFKAVADPNIETKTADIRFLASSS